MKINLKHIHKVTKKTANGGHKIYYYHRYTRARLPDNPNSIEFMAALEEQDRFGRPKEGTLGQLIEEYKTSPEFTQRSVSTHRAYQSQMDKLKPLSNLPIQGLMRTHCKKIQAKYSDKPATANLLIKFLNVLMKFAVEMGYRKDNPAAGMKSFKTGEYRPWSNEELEAFVKGASPQLTIGIQLGLYTGQRVSDCLKMRWSDFDGETIFVVQKKTGAELHIPCHPILLSSLNDIPTTERIDFIISKPDGTGYTDAHFRKMFGIQRDNARLPGDVHFHGLRKSAAVALAEAGCTERQIMSITGHKSFDMVTHYVKKADQKKQAKQAIDKLAKG